MSGPPYFLQFTGATLHAERVGWTGAWPPPERMWVAFGEMTDLAVFLNPDDEQPAGLIDKLDELGILLRYTRVSYSELPELSHVARGAEYVLEDQGL